MYFNIYVKKIIANKWFMCVLVIFLIGIFFVFNTKINEISLGKRIMDKEDILSIFNIKSYQAEYELTVISNKTINTYYIKEWSDLSSIKIEEKDSVGNDITVIYENGNVSILNSGEKSSLYLSNISNLNICTFMAIVKSIDIANAQLYDKRDAWYIYYDLPKDNVYGISYIVIELDRTGDILKQINMFDENKNLKYGIVYTKFEKDIDLQDNLFKAR